MPTFLCGAALVLRRSEALRLSDGLARYTYTSLGEKHHATLGSHHPRCVSSLEVVADSVQLWLWVVGLQAAREARGAPTRKGACMTSEEFHTAANAIALAAWKLMVVVEREADGLPEEVVTYARELRAVSSEWCPQLPARAHAEV